MKVISKEDWNISNYNLVEYKIHFKHDRPIKSSVQYINSRLANWLKSKLQKIEEIEVIWKLYNPYISSITIVEVLKSDGKWKIKFYSNTTELNKVTIKDAGSLPNFCMIFDKLEGTVIYTIINMVAEYW